jgi:hypothetical protein
MPTGSLSNLLKSDDLLAKRIAQQPQQSAAKPRNSPESFCTDLGQPCSLLVTLSIRARLAILAEYFISTQFESCCGVD